MTRFGSRGGPVPGEWPLGKRGGHLAERDGLYNIHVPTDFLSRFPAPEVAHPGERARDAARVRALMPPSQRPAGSCIPRICGVFLDSTCYLLSNIPLRLRLRGKYARESRPRLAESRVATGLLAPLGPSSRPVGAPAIYSL